MSILGKVWKIKNNDGHAPLVEKLLANRGITSEQDAERFLNPNASRDFHDPFLMADMHRVVDRIGQAIENGERMMIFGDYDVDGITGCAILMRALRQLRGSVSYRLPHRVEDGYGLRQKFIEEFEKLDVKVIITVDNGISCFNEITAAREKGIDVIITDHHTIPERIPPAYAILHPKLPGCGYPFTELTGAGVALKLAQALFMTRLSNKENATEAVRALMDLACMGTIADVGLMHGENRFIVREGLKVLENTRWPGLSRLKENAGIKGALKSHDIGFLLGPRINAAGRISHPSHALKLLLHDSDKSHELAENLEQLNRRRQKLMGELMEVAKAMAVSENGAPVIAIWHKDFHAGVIGLLAAKLSEAYGRPAIVMEDRGETLVGSCRSVPDINIVEALQHNAELFINFGGHAAAAGFEIKKENVEIFKERLLEGLIKKDGAPSGGNSLHAECELLPHEMSNETVDMLANFEPFGAGNEAPRFVCKKLKLMRCDGVGAEKKHLKLSVSASSNQTIDCIGFQLGHALKKLSNGDELDMVCELTRDTWNGRSRLQLKIIDLALPNS